MKLPDKIFGQEVDGAYKKYLVRTKNQKPKPEIKPSAIVTPADIQNPESYLILQGNTHGNYSYPDLLVSMDKYHHNKTWYKTQEDLHNERAFMLTIRQFIDFINLLKSGKANNGKGKQVDKADLDKILDEIITVRRPWRAEWLDAKFSKQGITYHNIKNDGTLEEVTEPLEDCLRKDKTPGIDLDSWLNSANNQGLPTNKTKNGSLCYWHPKEGYVAGCGAESDRVDLGWIGDPVFSDSALGVRVARVK
jgi:hypothetical protein